MANLDSVYVACSSAGVLALLRQRHADAALTPDKAFIELPLGGAPFEREEWIALSRRLAVPVFHLRVRLGVDSFRYERFVAGVCVRTLQYGCDKPGVWEVVEGEPEAWEAAAFFAQARAEESADPRRHAVESLWRGHRVHAGAYYPVVDARHAARALAAHYRLQGW